MPIDGKNIRELFKWQYQTDELVPYAAWVLEHEHETLQDALKTFIGLVDPPKTGEGYFHRKLVAYRVWLLPNLPPSDEALQLAPEDEEKRRIGQEIVRILADSDLSPWDEGFFTVMQVDNDNWLFVLLDDGSWHGPLRMQAPTVSDNLERLEKNVIPIEAEVVQWIDVVHASTDMVPVSVGVIANGYGPYIGVVHINPRGELSAYEAIEEMKLEDPRFEEERRELRQELLQEYGDDEDAAIEAFYEQLREDINVMDYELSPWDAVSYAITVTKGSWDPDLEIE